jgi:hypothetical protein
LHEVSNVHSFNEWRKNRLEIGEVLAHLLAAFGPEDVAHTLILHFPSIVLAMDEAREDES